MELVFKGLAIGLIVDDIAGDVKKKKNNKHEWVLRSVLQRAREQGVRFNIDKCIFDQQSIPYFGHL